MPPPDRQITEAVSPADFRRALGHYPTGVAVVTACRTDGDPLAMVVGTFTSVSLDPPLVGFLPSLTSTTWPDIRATGGFCVNVLGADQEQVCRAFASKAPDRFTAHTDGGPGNPRLTSAVLRVDCDIFQVLPAGDHEMVLGAVRRIEVAEEPGLPLLFLRGGYGAPHLASIQAESAGLADQLRLADLIRPEAESISRDLGLECLVTAPADDSIVVLAAAGIGSETRRSTTRVGTTFPLAAPFGPLFVAWAAEAERKAWLTRGQTLTGITDRSLAVAQLAAVRELGYGITTGREAADHFERVVTGMEEPAAIAEFLTALERRGPEPGLHRPVEKLTDVTSMHVPVRDATGQVVLALHLIGFTGQETPGRLRACLDRLRSGGRSADALLSRSSHDDGA